MTNKSVSVVIANFNQSKYIVSALEKLIKNKNLDSIVVVDDSSSDNSVELISKFPKVKLIKNLFQRGVSYSLNLGIASVNSDYVIIQGGDDESSEDRIDIQRENIQRSSCSVLIGQNTYIDEDGKSLNDQYVFRQSNTQDIFEQLFISGNFICAPAAILDRKAFLKVGGFKNNLQQLQDYFLWLQVSLNDEMNFHQETIVKYRIHQNNLSKNRSKYVENRIDFEYFLIYDYFFNESIKYISRGLPVKKLRLQGKKIETRIDLIKFFLTIPNKNARKVILNYFNRIVLSGEKIENDLAVLGLTIYDLILMNGSSDV